MHSLPTLCCSSRSVVCNNLKYSCLKHRRPSIVKRADILNFRKLFLSSLSLSLSLEKSDKKLQIYHFVSNFFFFAKDILSFRCEIHNLVFNLCTATTRSIFVHFFFLAPRGFFEPIFHSHSFSRLNIYFPGIYKEIYVCVCICVYIHVYMYTRWSTELQR